MVDAVPSHATMYSRVKRRPVCFVIAGPNGAGKTTYALRYLAKVAKCMEFINADLIAHGLSPLRMEKAMAEAGRMVLGKMQELASKRADFAFETTLAGRSHAVFLQELKRMGYRIELHYLWIPSAAFSARRVAARVAQGGHNVPLPVIKRRYGKSLANLYRLYMPLADFVSLMDNSLEAPRVIAERQPGGGLRVFEPDVWRLMREADYGPNT
jgi:predicted ABC-type ATPase